LCFFFFWSCFRFSPYLPKKLFDCRNYPRVLVEKSPHSAIHPCRSVYLPHIVDSVGGKSPTLTYYIPLFTPCFKSLSLDPLFLGFPWFFPSMFRILGIFLLSLRVLSFLAVCFQKIFHTLLNTVGYVPFSPHSVPNEYVKWASFPFVCYYHFIIRPSVLLWLLPLVFFFLVNFPSPSNEVQL